MLGENSETLHFASVSSIELFWLYGMFVFQSCALNYYIYSQFITYMRFYNDPTWMHHRCTCCVIY